MSILCCVLVVFFVALQELGKQVAALRRGESVEVSAEEVRLL